MFTIFHIIIIRKSKVAVNQKNFTSHIECMPIPNLKWFARYFVHKIPHGYSVGVEKKRHNSAEIGWNEKIGKRHPSIF